MTINFDKDRLDVFGATTGGKVWQELVPALMSIRQGAGPGDRQRAYDLALIVRDNPADVEIAVEDAAFIKEWVGWILNPLDVGQINACLEGK